MSEQEQQQQQQSEMQCIQNLEYDLVCLLTNFRQELQQIQHKYLNEKQKNKRKRGTSKSWSKNNNNKKMKMDYSDEQRQVLKTWLSEHEDNPYPTSTEKQELCEETGLDFNQVNNWFVNARKRYLAKKNGLPPMIKRKRQFEQSVSEKLQAKSNA